MTDRTEEFAQHRGALVDIAYRMLGSLDEAEDVVQEAVVRAGAAGAEVREPQAFLTRVVTNACLDRLRSARVRRESYVGTWLPEPVVGPPWGTGDPAGDPVDPGDRVTLDEQTSLALLAVLETLSPAERAVYVLHEAFGMPLAEVAEVVGRSPQACRQLAVRARRHVRERAPRFDPDPGAHRNVVAAFQAACENGDLESLAHVLDDHVVLRADGGGVARATARPVEGRADVLRTIAATLRATTGLRVRRRLVNGSPGLVADHDHGTVVLAFVVHGGRITAVDIVANPAKLGSLGERTTPGNS